MVEGGDGGIGGYDGNAGYGGRLHGGSGEEMIGVNGTIYTSQWYGRGDGGSALMVVMLVGKRW